jgi:hypothetical protein
LGIERDGPSCPSRALHSPPVALPRRSLGKGFFPRKRKNRALLMGPYSQFQPRFCKEGEEGGKSPFFDFQDESFHSFLFSNPCGKYPRRNREGCCTALDARSRWFPWAGDSWPGGKGIGSFPGSGFRSACTPGNPFGPPPLPRFRKSLRRKGSDIRRWAFLSPLAKDIPPPQPSPSRGEGREEVKFLFPDHLGAAARAIHLEAGNRGLMGGSGPALGADAFSARTGPWPCPAHSSSATAASLSASSSCSAPASTGRSRSVSSGHFNLLFEKP